MKQKPKHIIKQVKEKKNTHFIDEKNYKRDRQIIKRRIFKNPNEIPDVKLDREITGRNYSEIK